MLLGIFRSKIFKGLKDIKVYFQLDSGECLLIVNNLSIG